MTLQVRPAIAGDAALILQFVRDLAVYEKLEHEAVATVEDIETTLFTSNPKSFCLIAELDGAPCGFALYFFNYSTFLGKHGIYLEDLFVNPQSRGAGVGKALLMRLAQIAKEKRLWTARLASA